LEQVGRVVHLHPAAKQGKKPVVSAMDSAAL
jgi:hypothetical protein